MRNRIPILRRLTGLVLALIVVVGALPVRAQEAATLTILHTNDIHGRAIGDDPAGEDAAIIGYERFATIVAEYQAAGDTLVLDAGDVTHGTTFANLAQGENMIEVMNSVGVQALTPGNHEFNYGFEQVLRNAELADFPVLAANIVADADGSKPFESTTLVDYGEYQVGIFGLVTPETKYKAHPDNTAGLSFIDVVEAAEASVAELEAAGADVIVLLSHLGINAASDVTTYTVLDSVAGIDVVIDGHSHSSLPEGEVYEEVLIAQTGGHFAQIGVVELTLDADGTVSEAVASHLGIEEAAVYAPDAAVVAQLEALSAEAEELLNVELGESLVELDGVREHVRAGETNLGNLITDAMLDLSDADVALTNGGGIRDSIVAGPVTTGDVLRVLPFNNTLIVIEVSGQDILDALTFGVSDYPDPQGKFPHVAGLSFFILTGDDGNQVHQVMVGDAPLDPEATYSLATNDFMAVGGDGYEMFAGATQLALYGDLAEVVNEYILAHSPVAPEVEGRITAGDVLPAGDDDDAVAEIPKTGEFESGSVYIGAGLLAVAVMLLVLRKKRTEQDAA